jgi:hypothetical protein
MSASRFSFLFGCNYPWTLLDGVSNYGRDVGVTPDGSHTGLSTRRDLVAGDFSAMRSLGLNVLRWFVFCDGRAGIRFDAHGFPAGLSEHVFDDLDVAVGIASLQGILLIPVLFDYLWMFDRIENRDDRGRLIYSAPGHAEVMKSEAGRAALLETVIRPVLERYAASKSIFAWEFMNEPDWVVSGPDLSRTHVASPISHEEYCGLVREVGAEVHARTSALYTLGTARAKGLSRWGQADPGVDFLQVHAYEDFWKHGHDMRIRGSRPQDLGVDLPVVVGEYPVRGEGLDGFVDELESSGYAGALFWSFNNVDRCGVESAEKIGSVLTAAAPRVLSRTAGLA